MAFFHPPGNTRADLLSHLCPAPPKDYTEKNILPPAHFVKAITWDVDQKIKNTPGQKTPVGV